MLVPDVAGAHTFATSMLHFNSRCDPFNLRLMKNYAGILSSAVQELLVSRLTESSTTCRWLSSRNSSYKSSTTCWWLSSQSSSYKAVQLAGGCRDTNQTRQHHPQSAHIAATRRANKPVQLLCQQIEDPKASCIHAFRTCKPSAKRMGCTPGTPRNSRTIRLCSLSAPATISSGPSIAHRHSRPTAPSYHLLSSMYLSK